MIDYSKALDTNRNALRELERYRQYSGQSVLKGVEQVRQRLSRTFRRLEKLEERYGVEK